VLLLVPAAPRVAPAAEAQAEALFWDRHAACRRLLEARPDSAIALGRSLVLRDRDDFLGRWLVGQWAAAHDTASRAATVAAAEASPDRPGEQVEAGTRLLAENQTERGRVALDRAVVAYTAAGRPLDACRAALWKVVKRRERRDRPVIGADLDRAESLARARGEPAMLADVLMVRGDFEASQDVRRALKHRREALDLLVPLGASLQLAECHRDLGTALKTGGDFAAAEGHFHEAMRLAVSFADTTQIHDALAQLADVHRGRGDYAQADSGYAAALLLARADRDSVRMAQRHVDLGDLNRELGRFAEARGHYEASLRLRSAIGAEGNEQVSLLDGLGSIAALDGDYEGARRRYEEALAFCRQRGLKRQSAIVWLHLAAVHRDLGDPLQATALAERGSAAARESGHRRAELMLLSFRGDVARDEGRLDEALGTARQVAALTRDLEPRNLSSVLRDEATALSLLGRDREATAVVDSAIAVSPDSSDLSRSLQLQGSIRLQMRQGAAAVELLTRSLAIAEAMDSPEREADVKLALGAALLASGRPREAIAALESGLAWFERTRALVRSSEERSGWQSIYNDAFYSLAVAYARTHQEAAAFATVERGRARELRSLMDVRTRGLRGRAQPSLARSIERVEGDLAALQTRLLREYSRPVTARSRDLGRMEERADSLKLRWSDLNRRIESQTQGLARGGLPAALTAAQVEGALAPGERLLVFMVGQAGSLRFDFEPGRLAIHELPWNERAVARRVEALNALLRDGRAGWEASGADCADTLLGVANPTAAPPQRLFIVPDAALHYLPFEALRWSPDPLQPRRPLIEWTEVTYGSSVTLLMSPRSRARSGKTYDAPIVAFGDPAVNDTAANPAARAGERGGLPAVGSLPHARREVLALQKLYPRARVHLGAEATEARFMAEAGRSPIVHVAAHAFVDDRYPKFSGIALARTAGGGRADDGLLQAFEVLEGSFDLELATLSACESGRGALRRGEGITGLARAFQLAGARQLLVSLWKVDDAATADLMGEFYRRLARGEATATALRGAKLAFMHGGGAVRPGAAGAGTRGGGPEAEVASGDASRGVGAHRRVESRAQPSAWAPFVLIGDRGR
jgi:CHAT domain-containing protein/tetratricopeptide (TPR) repeat protein